MTRAGTRARRSAGTRLGPYRVLKKLGEGAAGIVYAGARGADDDRVVALKVLRAELRGSAAARARFRRELRAGRRLRHANLVRALHGFVADTPAGPRFVVVYDFVPGRTLRARVEAEGPLPEAEARAVADQALRALEALHGAGVLHRDVKPDHLLVDARGHVRLLDLGLARLVDEGRSRRLTRSGEVLGTPAFLSPEVATRGLSRAEPRTDLHGLGATLHFLLAGRPPVSADAATADSLRALGPPDVRASRPDVSPAFGAFVTRLLAPRPEARFRSARAARAALSRLPAAPRGTRPRPVRVLESDAFLPWVADAVRGERRTVLVRVDRATKDAVRSALDDLSRRCAVRGSPIAALEAPGVAPRGRAACVVLVGVDRARDGGEAALRRADEALRGRAGVVIATFGPRVPAFAARLLGDPRVAFLDVPILLRGGTRARARGRRGRPT